MKWGLPEPKWEILSPADEAFIDDLDQKWWIQWVNYFWKVSTSMQAQKARLMSYVRNFPWSAISQLSETQVWGILKRVYSLWWWVLELSISRIRWWISDIISEWWEEIEILRIKNVIKNADIEYLIIIRQHEIAEKIQKMSRLNFDIQIWETWEILIIWTDIVFTSHEILIIQWVSNLD